MLTFEHNQENDQLEIHADLEGLKMLATYIETLIQTSDISGNDHSHLMTADWGGSELTSEKQGLTNSLYHHVKLFCWADEG